MNTLPFMKKMTAITALSFALTAHAGTYAAVDKNSCQNRANTTEPFILVLSQGDKLHDSLTRCANDANLQAASVSGLGQVHNPILAYFSSNPLDKPTLTSLDGYYELASLNGNITSNNGQYYTHLHGTLADREFKGIAGHIDSVEAGLTVEITIIPFSGPVERTVDEHTGFGPISTR